jgi:hypothetical protein
MIPESKYLPDTCRTKLTFGPETACEAKGLILRVSTTVRLAVLTGVGNGKRTSYSMQGLVASLCSALVKNSFGALIMRHYRLPCGNHYQVCNSAPILLPQAGWSLRPHKVEQVGARDHTKCIPRDTFIGGAIGVCKRKSGSAQH